jgi:hypothetical protein
MLPLILILMVLPRKVSVKKLQDQKPQRVRLHEKRLLLASRSSCQSNVRRTVRTASLFRSNGTFWTA